MSAPRRTLALLVASALLVAASAPCPPDAAEPAGARAHGHDSHALDHGPGVHADHVDHVDQEIEAQAFLARPCLCGCQTESSPARGGGRLGYALARAGEPADRPARQPLPALAAPRPPPAPHLGDDPVPI